MPVCELCKKENKLADSHILPEWIYTTTYRKRKIFRPIQIAKSNLGKEEQKGYREPLLCISCENKFSRFEDYSKHLFYSIVNDKFRNLSKTILSNRIYELRGVNYDKIKLFLLSVLWRLNISQNEMFAGYKIKNGERIREVLFKSESTDRSFYPIAISKLLINGKSDTGALITFAEHISINSILRFRIVLAGVIVDYFITENNTDRDIDHTCINENGSVLVYQQDINEWDSYEKMRDIFTTKEIASYYNEKSD